MEKYITQLKDEEIEAFFIVNGYKLCKDLTTDDGEALPAIERCDEIIMVRAQQEEKNDIDTQLAYHLAKTHPGFMSFALLASAMSGYSRNIDIIHFSDYYLSKFCLYPEDEHESERLCSAYVNWLNSKFPTYRNDYQLYWEKFSESHTSEQDNTL